MSLNQVLEKYFTADEMVKVKEKMIFDEGGNELNIGDIKFTLSDDRLILKDFPSKFGYEVPGTDEEFRTWEGIAFIKVRIINTAEDIILRARTGDLYDESYYTARGGGGPYTKYPLRSDGVSEEERFKELAVELLKKYGKIKILDSGCATGFLVKPLQDLGMDAYGFDISEFAINNGICTNLFLADGRKLPFKDNEFDLLISQDYMEHIHPDDLPAVLKEQKRVLKKNGIALHFIPFYKDFKSPVQIDAHLCTANRSWWKNILEQTNILTLEFMPDEEDQWDYTHGILSQYIVLRNPE